MNGYDLTRNWFNYKFEHPEKVKAIHTDFYFYLVDQWNRLGQKKSFGLPTSVSMECLGIRSYNTYKKTLCDLIDFGFVILLQESKNQHQSKIVAISKTDKALNRALDKASIKALDNPTDKAIDSIYKQLNKETKEQINNIEFDLFWNKYSKKVDSKKCKEKFLKLDKSEIETILKVVDTYVNSTPDVQFRKNPLTWLNGQCWKDVELNEFLPTPEKPFGKTNQI